MVYQFVVYGNQENPKGNPIPYHRQTQRSARFNKQAKRYHAWKDYVRAADVCIILSTSTMDRPINHKFEDLLTFQDRVRQSSKIIMDLKIYFANKRHADPDNIFKGIADSVFVNDKYVAGSFDFDYDKENPRVEASIRIT